MSRESLFSQSGSTFNMTVKFLIIRFSSIGDIVLTTPVMRNLKQQVDDAEIHFLTKNQFRSILDNNVYVDKVHVLEGSFKQTAKALKSERFDYVIDLHNNLRSARVKLNLKMLSFTVKKLNYEKWLMVKFKQNRLPDVHIVDRYLNTIRFFLNEPDKNGLDYFIPQKDEVDLHSLPKDFHTGYVGWVIGAKHNTKKFPKSKIISIVDSINYPVVLLGGPEDYEDGKYIEENTSGTVLNCCGKYNLNQSASFTRQAQLVVSNDTGLMHIAASFGKNIISLWGNTIPAFGMYPYVEKKKSVIMENNNLDCRPCSKIGFKKCPKNHFKCMNDLKNQEISKSIEIFLQL
jgi:ADP-heptose:LPS heptosyltransferase